MNATTNDNWGASREEVLIGRIVDGEASQQDFDELERLGATDADVWRRLAEAQRSHARLERAVEDRIALADLIELPKQRWLGGGGVIAKIGMATGWAAAAVLGLVVFVQMGPGASGPVVPVAPTGGGSLTGNEWAMDTRSGEGFDRTAMLDLDDRGDLADSFADRAGEAALGSSMPSALVAREQPGTAGLEYVSFGPLLTTATPDEAFQQYLLSGIADGQVIAEMPSQLVEVRQAPGSDVQEVYLIRRTLERVPASEIWVPDVRMDDAGNVLAVPMRLREGATETAL